VQKKRQFSSAREAERDGVIVELTVNKSYVRAAEEFPLLEVDARERLVKTQKAGEDLACSDL
jgi:chemotaxis methyl-accepting protein methylase